MTTVSPEHSLATRAITQLENVIGSLTPDDLGRRSPCPDWTVTEVLAHVAGTASALAAFARTGQREMPEQVVGLDDPIGDARDAIHELRTALAEGSEHAQRAAGDASVEFTTHAWDLDPSTAIPEDLASDVHAFVSPLVDDDVRRQFFGPQVPVPADASAADRLLGFLGRDPAFDRDGRIST